MSVRKQVSMTCTSACNSEVHRIPGKSQLPQLLPFPNQLNPQPGLEYVQARGQHKLLMLYVCCCYGETFYLASRHPARRYRRYRIRAGVA